MKVFSKIQTVETATKLSEKRKLLIKTWKKVLIAQQIQRRHGQASLKKIETDCSFDLWNLLA